MHKFKTIGQFHSFRHLPPPEHPLISITDLSTIKQVHNDDGQSMVFDFYAISLKHGFTAKVKYGQLPYDFDSGVMSFHAPGQVMRIEPTREKVLNQTGWMLCIHPDFLWSSTLAKKIRQYEFFDYAVNEALFLSDKEEGVITGIIQTIEQEYHLPIDRFTQEIIVTQLETLLAYSDRFYQRQFVTRKQVNHQLLDQLNHLLNVYFDGDNLIKNGLPTVSSVAQQLNVSPRYLSSLLRSMTGLNTQQHIHEKLIAKAKELLSTTELSVGEIAFCLGFEHLPSFSKLFKHKTKLSPLEFRQSFN